MDDSDPQYPSHSLSFKIDVAGTLDQKLDRLIPFLKSRTGPAIVYVTLQKHAEEVANHLRPHDLEPMVYHAGLPHEQRTNVQMQFMQSAKGIVCATIAFGMGIDKGRICLVVRRCMLTDIFGWQQISDRSAYIISVLVVLFTRSSGRAPPYAQDT